MNLCPVVTSALEKNQSKGDKEHPVELFKYKDVSGKALVTFNLRCERSTGSQVDMGEECCRQKSSKCGGPDAVICLVCLNQGGQCSQSAVSKREWLEMRSEGWWGAGSRNAIKASAEGLLSMSCPKFPHTCQIST